jgi:hypothetical protein
MWRAVLVRPLRRPRPLLAVAGVLLATLALSGCDVEADLAAYFGTPRPSASASAGTPSPSTTPSQTASPPPSATPSIEPSPSASSSAPPSTSPPPTGSPLPTRPPGLAEWQTLRERARIVEYDKLVARPADFEGEFVYFEGHVLGVIDDGGGHMTARIRSGGKVMHWTYDLATYWGQPLVQGDRVRVVGDFAGLENDADSGARVPVIESLEILVKFT